MLKPINNCKGRKFKCMANPLRIDFSCIIEIPIMFKIINLYPTVNALALP